MVAIAVVVVAVVIAVLVHTIVNPADSRKPHRDLLHSVLSKMWWKFYEYLWYGLD